MDEVLQEIDDLFEDADLTLIKEVLYFDGWSTYEESGGYLIFRAIDDSIQKAEFGYSVMAMPEDNRDLFYLEEITEEESLEYIKEMNQAINETI